jgi:hypothetical protein
MNDDDYAIALLDELHALHREIETARTERDMGRKLVQHLTEEGHSLRLQREQRVQRNALLLELEMMQDCMDEKKEEQLRALEDLCAAKQEYETLFVLHHVRWPAMPEEEDPKHTATANNNNNNKKKNDNNTAVEKRKATKIRTASLSKSKGTTIDEVKASPQTPRRQPSYTSKSKSSKQATPTSPRLDSDDDSVHEFHAADLLEKKEEGSLRSRNNSGTTSHTPSNSSNPVERSPISSSPRSNSTNNNNNTSIRKSPVIPPGPPTEEDFHASFRIMEESEQGEVFPEFRSLGDSLRFISFTAENT